MTTRAATSTKRERLVARITPEQKALIQRAARLQGRTLTDFVVGSVQEAAERAIREHEVITLTARDSRHFVAALLDPPAPNERLRTASQRHREMLGE